MEKIGYLVCNHWGGGKNYFYETLEEAWKDINKKHPHWFIEKAKQTIEPNGLIVYTTIEVIKSPWGN